MIRRIHLYFGLFLAPWVIMYAVSTAAMNHRSHSSGPPKWEQELAQPYARTFAQGAKPAEIGRIILADLGMQGAHSVNTSVKGDRITITRQDLITPRRVIYTPADQRLIVEKQSFAMPAFLERMHRRRGYQHAYVVDDAWAVTVDVVILAIIFWSLSGLWLWWEMKKTRWWGAACLVGGFGLFALFLVTI